MGRTSIGIRESHKVFLRIGFLWGQDLLWHRELWTHLAGERWVESSSVRQKFIAIYLCHTGGLQRAWSTKWKWTWWMGWVARRKKLSLNLFYSGCMPGALCILLTSYSNPADMISIYKLRKWGDESSSPIFIQVETKKEISSYMSIFWWSKTCTNYWFNSSVPYGLSTCELRNLKAT